MLLKPAKTITPPAWMTAPETRAVMDALNAGAAEPRGLFVGGCVRDALLETGDDDPDIDIATIHTPDKVTEILENAGLKVIPTGIDHGTVTAVSGARVFEITTLRKDVETDGRRAVVAFTDDWKIDAQRRDFTMNTVLADAQGQVYDPLGDGLADLEARRVKFVGDPSTRIAEDTLRILRFFRFHAQIGASDPDADALKACRDAEPKIVTLSGERITQEFLKLLNVLDPTETLTLMADNHILSTVLPTEFDIASSRRTPGSGGGKAQEADWIPAFAGMTICDAFRTLCALQNDMRLHSVSARLFVLIGMDADNLNALETSLVLSSAMKKEIALIGEALARFCNGSIKSDKELIYRYPRIVAGQVFLLSRLLTSFRRKPESGHERAALGPGLRRDDNEENLEEQIRLLKTWLPPAFPLNGQDVINAGIAPGPEVGRILAQIEQWWIDRDFEPGREACQKLLLTSLF